MPMLTQNINPNETTSASQRAQIFRFLRAGETITWQQAVDMFKCARLAARIGEIRNELKAAGGKEKVVTTMIKTPNGKKTIARYSLVVVEPETDTP